MEIADRRVATVHFSLIDDTGTTRVSTHGHAPLVHLQGSGGIIPALEQALPGKSPGDRFQVRVEPEQGFGARHPELEQTLPRSAFNGTRTPAVGDVLDARTRAGSMPVRVTAVDGENIAVDGNHPFAGMPFTLDVEVVDVRLATPDEIQFGLQPVA